MPRSASTAPGDSTGSGKTSPLHSLSGLFQHFADGRQGGLIEVAGIDRASTPPRDTAAFVDLVSQNVRFVLRGGDRARRDRLRPRGARDPPAGANDRVTEVAAQLGITHLLARPALVLSAGEATLVALAAALFARRPCDWSTNPWPTSTLPPGAASAPCSMT